MQVHVLAQLVPNMPGTHAIEIHRENVEIVVLYTDKLINMVINHTTVHEVVLWLSGKTTNEVLFYRKLQDMLIDT